jgi:hypothetical protein
VILSLTQQATSLMGQLFPQFNDCERDVVSPLAPDELDVLTQALRKIVLHLETRHEADQPRTTMADPGPANAAELP